MSWLIYGAVGYIAYKLVKGGDLSFPGSEPEIKPKKKKKKKPKKKKRRVVLKPPHEVLGVAEDASDEEIRHAYQELMRKYHPDRVANAADELRELANRRSKEINAAYELLAKRD